MIRSMSLPALALMSALLLQQYTASAEAILHRGNAGEPQTLDPAHTSLNIEDFILKDLFEGLTVYDPTGEIQPGSASEWTISNEGTVYTFKIRADAKWSDGTPLSAADFVYSFQRTLDPVTAAGYANILYPIKNAEKVNKGEVPLSDLGVRATDEKTLEIALEHPTPFFLELLAHQAALPVNKANVERDGKNFTKPGTLISNGAFHLVAHTPNDSLVVEKSATYWGAADVKLDKVVFYPIDDQSASVRRFEAGEMDLVFNFSSDQIDRLRSSYGEQVHVSPMLGIYYYAFDTRHEPFSDVNVRRALSMSIDREFLAKKIYSASQLPAYSMVPPGIASYGQPATADFAGISQLDREDKAVELLKAAGLGKGGKPLEIEIRYNTNPNHERVATAIADMWKKVLSAKVKLVNLDIASHYDYLEEGGAFDVARAGWTADYADAESFLALSSSTNASFNFARYNNPTFDALIKRSYTESDEQRSTTLREAESILLRDQPNVPLLFQASLWLVSDRVQGWHDNAANQHLSRYLSVNNK